MANGNFDKKTATDHKRKYYEASGVLVPGHMPYNALDERTCPEPDCGATGNRQGRAFCHKFGCSGKPDKAYMAEQARLQRKWEAGKALSPAAAPYLPKAGGRARGGAAPNAENQKLAAENKRLAAENKRLAAGSGTAPNTQGKPPAQGIGPTLATAKAVKE